MKNSNKNQDQKSNHNDSLNKTLKILALALIAILTFSCSKDDDGGTQPPEPTEQLRLKTYTVGSTETNFSYNSDNMLSSWIERSNVSNVIYDSENRPTQVGFWSYSYNTLGRMTGITYTSYPTTYYANFIYNNEGLVVTCNFRSGSSTFKTRTFEYNANSQLVEMIEEEVGKPIYKFLLSYDGNGNISQVKGQKSRDEGATYTDLFTNTYTYDDKKNPSYELLKSLGITSHLSFVLLSPIDDTYYIYSNSYFQPFFYSPNNVLTRTYGGSTFSYDYVYNEAGLPTSVEITKNDGTITYENWIYETDTE